MLAQIVGQCPGLCRQATHQPKAGSVHGRRYPSRSGDGDVPACRRENPMGLSELFGPIAGWMAGAVVESPMVSGRDHDKYRRHCNFLSKLISVSVVSTGVGAHSGARLAKAPLQYTNGSPDSPKWAWVISPIKMECVPTSRMSSTRQ